MAALIGIVCGPLGALLLTVNTYLNMIRARFCEKKWMKLVEILVLALLTSTCFFFAP
jgi:hypothetical protein